MGSINYDAMQNPLCAAEFAFPSHTDFPSRLKLCERERCMKYKMNGELRSEFSSHFIVRKWDPYNFCGLFLYSLLLGSVKERSGATPNECAVYHSLKCTFTTLPSSTYTHSFTVITTIIIVSISSTYHTHTRTHTPSHRSLLNFTSTFCIHLTFILQDLTSYTGNILSGVGKLFRGKKYQNGENEWENGSEEEEK